MSQILDSVLKLNLNRVKQFDSAAGGVWSVLYVVWVFFMEAPLAISFLSGSRVAGVPAHQPVEQPRKLATKPWD